MHKFVLGTRMINQTMETSNFQATPLFSTLSSKFYSIYLYLYKVWSGWQAIRFILV